MNVDAAAIFVTQQINLGIHEGVLMIPDRRGRHSWQEMPVLMKNCFKLQSYAAHDI